LEEGARRRRAFLFFWCNEFWCNEPYASRDRFRIAEPIAVTVAMMGLSTRNLAYGLG